jgi:hypothetical protein
MPRKPFLYGLNSDECLLAFQRLLFSPSLQKHLGDQQSLRWCEQLIDAFHAGDQAAFNAHYRSMAVQVKAATSGLPGPSIDNPPWAMMSLDMLLGMIPWQTPMFERFLFLFLSTGSVMWKGKPALPIAFILAGGPGDSKQTAIRICASSSVVRVSAEYWRKRAYLWIGEAGPHFTLSDDEHGRKFSLHSYKDRSGEQKNLYFDITSSFGRENADFMEFLHQDVDRPVSAPQPRQPTDRQENSAL